MTNDHKEMSRIGLLLPRSTDYPAMGFDILDGLRARMKADGHSDVQFFTENIGFGEDPAANYAKAEKLLLQEGVQVLIAYCNPINAEPLYALADAMQKPMIVLDAGMQLPEVQSENSYHISLQGTHACRIAGNMAGSGHRKVLMATSFYDGGYRGPWGYDRGLAEAGGSVCANYVSTYRVAEFTIDSYMDMLKDSGAASVGACFSSYLAELFFKALNEKKDASTPLPFYCSPFMAEEQMLGRCEFPGGSFHTIVPWALSLKNEAQDAFKEAVGKTKAANLFHLLGWEAGIVAQRVIDKGVSSLKGFSYESPRGTVTIDANTHHTYAPLYEGKIVGDAEGKCALEITGTIAIDAAAHKMALNDRPDENISGWKNNYLCI